MPPPKKVVTPVIGERIKNLKDMGLGLRNISKRIASEIGVKYSHTFIGQFLTGQGSGLSNYAANVSRPPPASPMVEIPSGLFNSDNERVQEYSEVDLPIMNFGSLPNAAVEDFDPIREFPK